MFRNLYRFMEQAGGDVGDGGSGGGAGGAGGSDGGAGGDGAGGAGDSVVIPENWHQALPEDFRNDPSISKFKTVEDLAKSYTHIQKQVGKDKIPLPDKEFATDDDWKGVFEKLGLPGDKDGYQLSDLPEGFTDDDAAWLKEAALGANILPNQLSKFVKAYGERTSAQTKAMMDGYEQEIVNNKNELKKEYGAAYDSELERATGAAKYLFADEGVKMLENTGLSGNPHMVRALVKVADMMKDAKIVNPKGGEGFEAMTPEKAQTEVNKIMGDTEHPYWKSDHPSHMDAVKKVQSLNEMIYFKD